MIRRNAVYLALFALWGWSFVRTLPPTGELAARLVAGLDSPEAQAARRLAYYAEPVTATAVGLLFCVYLCVSIVLTWRGRGRD